MNGVGIASTNPITAITPNKPLLCRTSFSRFHHSSMNGFLQTLHARQHGTVVGEEIVDVAQEQVGFHIGWIGKIGVPDHILLKPDKLTDDEWEKMRRHPAYAFDMLSKIAYLRRALDIPYCHHKKWDGTGYPRGLKGEQIPLAARIFAIVDVYDAVTSDRLYRAGWTKERHSNTSASKAALTSTRRWWRPLRG